ncbi:MAG: hypothetical protein NT053_02445 [Cyanobacteria bacterium]|nr:hypothetical protein [Cyanobacteriota bacterium]
MLRSALTGATQTGLHQATPPPAVAGFRPFPVLAGQLVSIERTEQLRDDAGL